MSWIQKRSKYKPIKRKNYSVIALMERQGRINDQFQLIMNNLTLEDVIAIKLELAGKAAGGNIYGIPVWFFITDIVRDACIKFALSATRTKKEAARFLGLDEGTFEKYLRKFKTLAYFEDENIQKEEEIVEEVKVDRRG